MKIASILKRNEEKSKECINKGEDIGQRSATIKVRFIQIIFVSIVMCLILFFASLGFLGRSHSGQGK